MPDGSYRSVSSPSEVGNYLALEHRTFPDGRPRLSFSLRGVWTISLNRKEYRDWVRPVLAAVQDQAGRSVGNIPGQDGDVFVDAALIKAVVGNSTSRRMRAAVALVNDRMMAEEVTRRVKDEVAAMLRSARQVAPMDREGDSGVVVDCDRGGESLESAADADLGSRQDPGTDPGVASLSDLGRFVPVVEREIGGRKVMSVVARDMHVFLGGSRSFSNWFNDQKVRCRIVEDADYGQVVLNNSVQNPSVGRPRLDFVLTLRAAKEVGMMDKSLRGKELRLYLLDCEERYLAGDRPPSLPPSPQPAAVGRPETELSSVLPTPLQQRAPAGGDVLTQETMPLTLADFLVHRMLAMPYVARIAERLERQLILDLIKASLGDAVCRHPIDGRVHIARPVLERWWSRNSDTLAEGCDTGDVCVLAKGFHPPL